MGLPINLQDVLPTRIAKWSAPLFLGLSTFPFLLPSSWLSEMWLKQETVQWLLQVGISAAVLLVGSLIVLSQVIVTEQKENHRRALLVAWRKMVTEIASANSSDIAHALERHESFPSLKPHLDQNTIHEVYGGRTMIVGSTIPAALSRIQEEIAKLEKQWGLP